MNGLRQRRLEPAPGRQLQGSEARAAEDLLRQARQLKVQLAVFGKSARALHRRLDVRVPEEEVEAMRTPAANLLGTLECLIADDLKPVRRKLDELSELLNDPTVVEVWRVRGGSLAQRSENRQDGRKLSDDAQIP